MIKFIKGPKQYYDSSNQDHVNGIYFATDQSAIHAAGRWYISNELDASGNVVNAGVVADSMQ